MPDSNAPQLDLFDKGGQTLLSDLINPGEGGSDTFWQCLQVECGSRALAKDRKKLTSSVKPAKELTPTN